MITVLEILPGRVVVDSSGLHRVRIKESGRIIGELLTSEAAKIMVDTVRRCGLPGGAEAIGYDALPSTSASN